MGSSDRFDLWIPDIKDNRRTSLYAIGGNEKAAQLSGINTNKVYFIAYANMGLLAAVIFDVESKKRSK